MFGTESYMKRLACFFAFSLGIILQSSGQQMNIKLGPDEIALNQYFTITLEVQNDRIRSYEGFPEIKGFEKAGISSSSSMNVINGRVTSTQSVTQNYAPTAEGVFTVPPFTLTVNGNEVSSQGQKIKVGPEVRRQKRYDPFAFDPFEDFFGKRKPTEFIETKDDAFLALTVDKNDVYVGEGFTATLAFYVTDENRADLAFYDAPQQIAEILKEIKPQNCWEENFNIDKIDGERVMINNKMTTQYKIYQATFYPLNDDPIEFPSVGLKMIKYLRAKNPSFFSSNRKEDYKTYYSAPKTVEVKPLPPHPLKESVAVGRYVLSEDISSEELKTGESFNYTFTVIGEGNISAIHEPAIKKNDYFDFYSPNIEQRISRSNNKVRGSKSFQYYGIPNEPGEYKMADLMHWIYFDPAREEYDTLKSEIAVNVTGESKKNEFISSTDLGAFYDLIEVEDNTISDNNWNIKMKLITNILLFLMLIVSVFFIFKKQ